MKRRHHNPDPACVCCGNEQDLWLWNDGKQYCLPCLTCPHNIQITNITCALCLRKLHSVLTFQGPRIHNIPFYVDEAYREYGMHWGELSVWTFEEEDALGLYCEQTLWPVKRAPLTVPPPHHRF